mmetsp:Transcript_72896/g.131317  ORF Transcript_72896/g.131317 Transcript_72896/m.131317 type:complete len:261 (-) Transcript_72896:672-1454(-)
MRRWSPPRRVGSDRQQAAYVEGIEDPLGLNVLASFFQFQRIWWPVHNLVRNGLTISWEGRARPSGARRRSSPLPADLCDSATEQCEVNRPQRHLPIDENLKSSKGGLHSVGFCELLLDLQSFLTLVAEVCGDCCGHLCVILLSLFSLCLLRLSRLLHLQFQGGHFCRTAVRLNVSLWGVRETEVSIKTEVHKLHHCTVELQEGQHHSEVNLRRQLLCKLVRGQPCDSLPHDLCLEVIARDRSKDFAKCLRSDHVELELLI